MLRLASIFVAVCVGACFYTGPINDRPVARITIQTDGPHHKGQTVRFDAAKSDDDGKDLRAHWRAFACSSASPPICEPLIDRVTKENLADEFELDIPMTLSLADMAEINIELVVEDDAGAADTDVVTIVIENRVPTIQTSLDPGPNQRPNGGPVVTLPVYVSAVAEDLDGDALAITWDFRGPANSVRADVIFTEIAENTYELIADVDGGWAVIVTADDGVGGVQTEEQAISVSVDKEPCIRTTDPVAVDDASYIVERSQGPRRFAVLHVEDELDVFPLSDGLPGAIQQTQFSWKIATPDTNGQLVSLSGHVVSDYVLDPSAFSPGDLVKLQVEAADRVVRDPCDAAQTTCTADGDSSCFQRLTWGVEIR